MQVMRPADEDLQHNSDFLKARDRPVYIAECRLAVVGMRSPANGWGHCRVGWFCVHTVFLL